MLFATESGEPIHPRVVSEVDLLFGQLMSECESFYRDQMPTPYEDDSVGAFIEREFEDRISCHQVVWRFFEFFNPSVRMFFF